MLFSILNNATSGLKTTQRLIDTASRNISNSSTEGYHRKEQAAVTALTGGSTTGAVQRSVNVALTEQARKSAAASASAVATNAALTRIDGLFGDPAAEVSLPSRLSQLGDAFQALSGDPTRPLSYAQTVAAAETLADGVRSTFQAIDGEINRQLSAIPDDVAAANILIRKIADLNQKVPDLLAAKQDATDLIDQRDQAIEDLSRYLDITGFEDADGVYQVYTADNKLLASRTPHLLSVSTVAGVPARISVDDGTPPSATNAVWNPGGTLGARAQLVTKTLPAYKSQLDDLAGRLAENLSAANTGMGADLFNDGGSIAFDPANPLQAKDFAGRIRVNDAVLSTPTLLRGAVGTAVADLTAINAARKVLKPEAVPTVPFNPAGTPPSSFAANSSLLDAATQILGVVANDKQTAQIAADIHAESYANAKQKLSQDTGVNLDDELSKIVLLQNSYASSARVLTVAQQMLDELMRSVG